MNGHILEHCGNDSIPAFPGLEVMTWVISKQHNVCLDVIMNALLEYADSGDTDSMYKVFPRYLYDFFMKLVDCYEEYWKAGGK